MRKVVLQMQVSLDAFVGRPNGDVDWIFRSFDEEFTAWSVESLWQAGVHIMGSVTGRGLAEYWPSPNIEKRDEPFAPAMNQIPKGGLFVNPGPARMERDSDCARRSRRRDRSAAGGAWQTHPGTWWRTIRSVSIETKDSSTSTS
jgi:hypothetical protein